MGFPMAANLRKKIPKESVLYVNDVDTAAVERFVREHSSIGGVEVCSTAKEITDKSVRNEVVDKVIYRTRFCQLCLRATMSKACI